MDQLTADEIGADLLDRVWEQVDRMHRARLAHRSLRAANILVTADGPVIIDFGFGTESAGERAQAIDRAELLVSLATLVGTEPVLASATRTIGPDELATAAPYLQPLALSAATRKQRVQGDAPRAARRDRHRDRRGAGSARAAGARPRPARSS